MSAVEAIPTILMLVKLANGALKKGDNKLALEVHEVTEDALIAYDATGRMDAKTAAFVRKTGAYLDGREPGRLTEEEWKASADVTRDALSAWRAAGT